MSVTVPYLPQKLIKLGCTALGTELDSNRLDCRVSEEGPLCRKTVASFPVNTSGFLRAAGEQVRPGT